MNSFNQYIGSLFGGLKTLLIGMKTSITVFFRKKTTEQYPENRATLKISDRFRGTLVMPHDENNQHKCVACGLCQMACPNDTITVTSEMVTDEEGKKKKVLVKYQMKTFLDLISLIAILFINDYSQFLTNVIG